MQKSDIMKNITRPMSWGYYTAVLAVCMLLSAMICYGQIINSSAFLIVCLSGFLMLTAWAGITEITLPVLLYFLPWSPLLKLYVGGISFFTIALLISCVIFLVKNRLSLGLYQVILTAFLMILTLTAKILQGNSIANNYLLFFAMLLLFPCITKGSGRKLSFMLLTLFFAGGIITAALSARQVAGYPNISQFIKVDSYLSITRLSGYYGDPNFYSAQITACLAGILLLLNREKAKIRQIILIIVSVLLIYCGLLSASKSFIIVVACLFFVWILIQFEKDNRGSGRFRLIIAILCAGMIILSSSLFRDLFSIVNERFAYASNISQLTTGRTELWINYLYEFSHNLLLSLLGEGYTSVVLNNKASHNTIIQGIYQFGILGFPLVLMWLLFTLKNIFLGNSKAKINWKYIILMCIGVVLPWMSLDILFFDEFFLLPAYAAIGICFSSEPVSL